MRDNDREKCGRFSEVEYRRYFRLDTKTNEAKFCWWQNIFVWHLNLFYIFLCRLRLNRHGFSDLLRGWLGNQVERTKASLETICIKKKKKFDMADNHMIPQCSIQFYLSVHHPQSSISSRYRRLRSKFVFASSWQNFFSQPWTKSID